VSETNSTEGLSELKDKLIKLKIAQAMIQDGYGSGYGRYGAANHFYSQNENVLSYYFEILEILLRKGKKKNKSGLRELSVKKMQELFAEFLGEDWLNDLTATEKKVLQKIGPI